MASVTHQALLMAGTAGTTAASPDGWASPLSTVPPHAPRYRGIPFWADASSYAGAWLSPIPQMFVAPPPIGWARPMSVASPVYNARRADASSYASDWLTDNYIAWDSTTVASVTLTNGNLTATNTGTNPVNQGAHVAFGRGKTTGKWYVEIAFTTITSANGSNLGGGVGTTTSNFSQMGASATTGNMCYQSGNLWASGSSTGVTLGTRASGDVIGIAADLDNRKIWFKKVSGTPGNWNNSGLADPTTNVGGQTIPAGTIVPFCTFGGTGGAASNVVTLDAGVTAFVSSAPSGFVSGWPL